VVILKLYIIILCILLVILPKKKLDGTQYHRMYLWLFTFNMYPNSPRVSAIWYHLQN